MMHNTNVSNSTVMKFANDVSKSDDTFIAKLKSHPAVPRCFTVELIHDIEDIMSHIETLKEACSTFPESSLNFLNMFDILQNAFIDHKTEHQSLNYFKNMKTLIIPKQYSIGVQKRAIKK